MEIQKKKFANRPSDPQKRNRFKRLCLAAGLLAASIFGNCTKETQREHETRCYGLKNGNLSVYVDRKNKSSLNNELGEEQQIDFSKLNLADNKDNREPLAYSCTHSGHLFWVTKDTVYIKKLSLIGERFAIAKVLDAKHVDPSEYSKESVRIVSADIWNNPDEKYDQITIATLTNTGLLQASLYSLKDLVNQTPQRAILNFVNDNVLDLKNKWPDKDVSAGAVNILDRYRFSVIPLGEKGKGSVRSMYYVEFGGKAGESLKARKWSVEAIQIWDGNPTLKNIFRIVAPVRFKKEEGGWFVDLQGEKEDGNLIDMVPLILKDEEKK